MKNTDTITIDTGSMYSSGLDYVFDTSVGNIEIASGADSTVYITGADYGINLDWLEDQDIVSTEREERIIRDRNEGVQKAWEQYKIMVELAKNPPDLKNI